MKEIIEKLIPLGVIVFALWMSDWNHIVVILVAVVLILFELIDIHDELRKIRRGETE